MQLFKSGFRELGLRIWNVINRINPYILYIQSAISRVNVIWHLFNYKLKTSLIFFSRKMKKASLKQLLLQVLLQFRLSRNPSVCMFTWSLIGKTLCWCEWLRSVYFDWLKKCFKFICWSYVKYVYNLFKKIITKHKKVNKESGLPPTHRYCMMQFWW